MFIVIVCDYSSEYFSLLNDLAKDKKILTLERL